MSAKFFASTAIITDPLKDLYRELSNLAMSCHQHYDRFRSSTSDLVAGADAFFGEGATAFGGASDGLAQAWDERLAAIGEAIYHCNLCISALENAAEAADRAYVNDYVLDRILEELHPVDIVADGIDAAESAFVRVAQGIADALNAGEHWLLNLFEDGLQLLEKLIHLGEVLVSDVWGIIVDTARVVRGWATEVYEVCARLMKQLGSFIASERLGIRSKVPGAFTSQYQEVAAINKDGYDNNTPIGISTMPDGHTLLLSLAGLQAINIFQDNNLKSAVEGGTNFDNAYLHDVLEAMTMYAVQHGITPPIHVDIVGHSLGGIVGQQLNDLAQRTGSTLFTVDNVVTFGSPIIDPTTQANVHAYFSMYDKVPYLSPVEAGRVAAYAASHHISPTDIVSYLDTHPDQKAVALGEQYINAPGDVTKTDPGLGTAHGQYFSSASAAAINQENWGFSPVGATNTEFFPTNIPGTGSLWMAGQTSPTETESLPNPTTGN